MQQPVEILTVRYESAEIIRPDSARFACDLTDGIRVVLSEGWVHVRASNTESMIRIIVEAEELPGARSLLDWARDRLKT